MANTSFYTGTGANSTDVSSVVSNKTAAAASEAAAAVSEANAASSATSASTSATAASTSATAASTSATAANTSKVAAETAQAASEAALDSFTDQYLGAKSSDPSTDNDGNALSAGALYWNTSSQDLKVYSGSAWVAGAFTTSTVLLKADNLSGLANVATARTNLGLSTIASTGAYSDLSGAPSAATTSAAGLMSAADKTKLDAIETGATADQTNAQIKAAYEANSDTNAFTDAEKTKLNDIEIGSDATDSNNVRAAGALMDDELTDLSAVKAINQSLTTTANVQFATVNGRNLNTDTSKLDGIETGATADQTASEIRALVESATDSNVFTDADHTKLNGIATSANNYVHPNHTGEVTSTADGATVIADNVVDEANLKISNNPTNGYVLTARSNNAGGMTWEQVSGGGGGGGSGDMISSNNLSDVDDVTTARTNLGAASTAVATTSANGLMSSSDKSRLDGIDAVATTSANGFISSSDKTKLDGVESGATADQTASEIESIVSHDNLQGFVANEHIDWTTDQGSTDIHAGNYTNTTYSVGDAGLTEKNFTTALKTKLDGIEAAATADQDASEIRALVESATDSNVFTDADHTKLDGIATSANNYSHPNHSGEVTSTADGATVIADNVVDEANLKISNSPTDGAYLVARSGNTGGMTWEQQGIFRVNAQTLSSDTTIASTENAMAVGPITVSSGVTFTVSGNLTII